MTHKNISSTIKVGAIIRLVLKVLLAGNLPTIKPRTNYVFLWSGGGGGGEHQRQLGNMIASWSWKNKR